MTSLPHRKGGFDGLLAADLPAEGGLWVEVCNGLHPGGAGDGLDDAMSLRIGQLLRKQPDLGLLHWGSAVFWLAFLYRSR